MYTTFFDIFGKQSIVQGMRFNPKREAPKEGRIKCFEEASQRSRENGSKKRDEVGLPEASVNVPKGFLPQWILNAPGFSQRNI